jgi:hypothetical protein
VSATFPDIKRLLDESDSFAAAAWLERQGAPEEVLELYRQATLWLYNEHQDVAGLIALSRSGIQYGLAEAARIAPPDAEQAQRLKGLTKGLAYNLGANTWPGWDDAGIVLTDSDLQVGLDAARLNLRLAIELQRGDEPLANALWLVGAQELARRKYPTATESFVRAADRAAATGKQDFEQMMHAYRALADELAQPSSAAGQKFETRIEALRQIGTDDGRFYAEQLITARRVFAKRAAAAAP